jgi:hypothetical protein
MHSLDHFILQFSKNRDCFKAILSGLNEEELHWRPQPEKWCLLEIICHLHDEEREDFRARLKVLLDTESDAFSPIDPEAWVNERDYLGSDYSKKLEAFISERNTSIKWLEGLGEFNANAYREHKYFGQMTAKLVLHNWLAHDYLHIRQINRYRYEMLAEQSAVSLEYAGNW